MARGQDHPVVAQLYATSSGDEVHLDQSQAILKYATKTEVTLLRVSFYQSIGGTPAVISLVVGAIVAWVVTKYYADKARNIKTLGWTPLGISKIVTRPVTDVAKGLALTWNGEPLRTPYTVTIRISNTGTREVVGGLSSPNRTDYIEPLVVDFGDSTCYQATITDARNTSIQVPLPVTSAPVNKFEILMPTLNVSSWLELEMIADGNVKYPDFSCFLEGQTGGKGIKPVAGRQRSRIKSAMLVACGIGLFVMIIGFGLLGLFAYNPQGPGLGPPVLMIIGGIIFVLAGLGFGYAWVLDRQEWNAMKRGAPGLFDRQ